MKKIGIWLAAAALLATPAFAQDDTQQGQGQAVVTVLPKHDGEVPPSVAEQDFSVKVNGKPFKVTKWAQIQAPDDGLELVVLIDGSARTSLGSQLDEIAQFVRRLPPNIKAAIAYMQNGRASFAGKLSADHDEVLRALHIPGGSAFSNASPWFCLSDLATHWPSQDREARREVVMVSDGIDGYDRQFDPEDPYVKSAIQDSVHAGLVVYSIYWTSRGDRDQVASVSNGGQSLLQEVAQATGGKSFYQGTGNPVSFGPFFDELTRCFRNQYELGFTGRAAGKPEMETLKLKLSAPGAEIDAPQQVIVYPASQPRN